MRDFHEIENEKISRKDAKISRKNYAKISWKKWKLCKKTLKICEKYIHQTFIKVKEEKLIIWHNKTSNIEVSEQRIPQVLLSN